MRSTSIMLALGLAGLPVAASAYDLPAVNLGGTSFYDGAPAPNGPGWYAIEYLQSINSKRMNDADGNKLGLPKQDINLFVPLTQVIYQSDLRWGNASPGVTVLLPWVADARVDDGLNHAALDSQTGLGDTIVGAFLQFDPIMGENGPRFSQRIELDVSIPTGSYDRNKAINPGNNFWTINPYYAATLWVTPKWSFSGRLFYLWNGKNDDPSTSLGASHDSQAGQALHANFTTEYALNANMSVGLNGYWLKQITDTQVDGEDVKGRREKVWAIGPGMVYKLGQDDSMFANLYFEQDAENRAQGNRFILRFNHHF